MVYTALAASVAPGVALCYFMWKVVTQLALEARAGAAS